MRWIVRGTCGLIGWSHKRGAALVAPDEQHSRKGVGLFFAPEEVDLSFEDRPQADTGPEPAIIEQEGPARNPVCADDALLGVVDGRC